MKKIIGMMNLRPFRGLLPASARRLLALAACVFVGNSIAPSLPAAESGGTGTIEGRVLNQASGDYVLNARISVEGTNLEAFTNRYGEYRLTNVPAGEATLRFFHTGSPERSKRVAVVPGEVATADFTLGLQAGQDDVVELDAFVVSVGRETDGRAIAINEQRFAPNLKNVVSTDEFGAVTEGNVGEFVKYLPGINVDYNAADARTISIRGLPSSATPVTVDGFRMASAASSVATRTFELEQVSINNMSRVEVTKVPTPDMPADALGGALNLVSRSAFERSRPQFTYRAYASFNSNEATLGKTPGPENRSSRKTTPGFDFSYVNPVSSNFGFTLNGLFSEQFNSGYRSQLQWAPTGLGVATVTPDNPYLARWLVQDTPKFTTRYSIGTKVDWRIAPRDVLSFGIQYNDYDAFFGGTNIQWDVGTNPADRAIDFTQGRANAGNVTIGTSFRHKFGNTIMPTLTYRHDGTVWKINAGASYSRSENHYRDIDDGFFENVTFRIPSQTVRFDSINVVRPGTVTNPIDPFSLANYRVLSARSSQNDGLDTLRTGHFNVARDLDTRIPLSIQAGADVRENERDIRYPQHTYTYVGPDGTANNADNEASAYVDPSRATRSMPYGLPKVQWPSTYKVRDALTANPSWFALDQTGAIALEANNSQNIRERITAAYVRMDARLFQNRVWVVGGVRFERTDDEGYGVLVDPSAIYQRNADGSFVRDNAGNRVPITTDPVAQARLVNQARGIHVRKSYDDYYPSLNASYNITENLIFRAGYAATIGRPDYRFIVPGTTILEPGGSAPNGRITVNNTGLLPWSANSFDLSLEYYLNPNGVVSVGVFRKDFKDFFGLTTQTVTAELLEPLGLDPDQFLGYDYVTNNNIGDARVTGLELNYSQALAFLPAWAEGFSLFANGTFLKLEGANSADFSDFVRKQANWGVRYERGKFSANVKWNYRGQQRRSLLSGTGIPADTYEYVKERLMLDADVTYSLRPWLAVFAAVRNATNDHLVYQRYAPTTPSVARTFRDEDYGAQWTVGVKGRF